MPTATPTKDTFISDTGIKPIPKNYSTDEQKESFKVTQEFLSFKSETKNDLVMRVSGVPAKRGASGFQLAGYITLQQFYRGDQWDKNEPPGGAQRTDNYCSVIIDNLSSLIFDDTPEINCPISDPTEEEEALKAEARERLLWQVWEKNNYEVCFDEWAKQASAYGDGFLVGPYMKKVDKLGREVAPDAEGTWEICFNKVENPASVRFRYSDASNTKVLDFMLSERMILSKALRMYGDVAATKGIKLTASLSSAPETTMLDSDDSIPKVNIDRYWTDEKMSLFVNDSLLTSYRHNWGFVPLRYVKNNYIPNYAYGKSDIEDILDPQLGYNRTASDLANLLRWISSINMWGKNVEGMQALVAGMSRIYSLPDDGELHSFEKTGDPYIADTYVKSRRSAIIEISGVSESLLSTSQVSAASGRALSLAFQGTIRKLNPRARRFKTELQHMNEDILKLYEIYFPKTKKIIEGNYRNKVHLPTTLLRNIVDTINKFQSGLISQETAMREAGVAQPKLEKKLMKADLMDPIIGPQVARQPSLLPKLSEGQNQPGDNPAPAAGNAPTASQDGAPNANNQKASGAAPVPTVTE